MFTPQPIGRVVSPLRDASVAPKQAHEGAPWALLESEARVAPGLLGVFSARSADRPNAIGLHRVGGLEMEAPVRLCVDLLEAIDGTPTLDGKPVIDMTL